MSSISSYLNNNNQFLYKRSLAASEALSKDPSGIVSGSGASGTSWISGSSGASGASGNPGNNKYTPDGHGGYIENLGIVEDLNIDDIMSLFTKGNLTVNEMDKWIAARKYTVKNPSKGKDSNGIIKYEFTYGGKQYNLSCTEKAAASQTDKEVQKTFNARTLDGFDAKTISKYCYVAQSYGNITMYALRPGIKDNNGNAITDQVALKNFLKAEKEAKETNASNYNIIDKDFALLGNDELKLKNNFTPDDVKNYLQENYSDMFDNGILNNDSCAMISENSVKFITLNTGKTELDDASLLKICTDAQVRLITMANTLNKDAKEFIDNNLATCVNALYKNQTNSVSDIARSRTIAAPDKNTSDKTSGIPGNILDQIHEAYGDDVVIERYQFKNKPTRDTESYDIKVNNNVVGTLYYENKTYSLSYEDNIYEHYYYYDKNGALVNQSSEITIHGDKLVSAVKDGTFNLNSLDTDLVFHILGENTVVQNDIENGMGTSFFDMCDALKGRENEIKGILAQNFESKGYNDLNDLLNNGDNSIERILSIAYFGNARNINSNPDDLVWNPNGVLYDTPTYQGYSGDCWFLSSNIAAAAFSDEYIQTIKEQVLFIDDENELYTVNFQGKEYTYSFEQVKNAKEFSNGDPDVRAMEMAAREYLNASGGMNNIAHGGLVNTFTSILTGKEIAECLSSEDNYQEIVDRIESNNYVGFISSMEDIPVFDAETGEKGDFVNQHAYAVVGSDDNYIYIVNPWDSSKKLKLSKNTLKEKDIIYDSAKISDITDGIKIAQQDAIHTEYFDYKPDKFVSKVTNDKVYYTDNSYDTINNNTVTRYDSSNNMTNSIIYNTDGSHEESSYKDGVLKKTILYCLDGSREEISYDKDGKRKKHSIINADGSEKTMYFHDGDGELSSIFYYDSNGFRLYQEHYYKGRLTSIEENLFQKDDKYVSITTEYEYDSNGNVCGYTIYNDVTNEEINVKSKEECDNYIKSQKEKYKTNTDTSNNNTQSGAGSTAADSGAPNAGNNTNTEIDLGEDIDNNIKAGKYIKPDGTFDTKTFEEDCKKNGIENITAYYDEGDGRGPAELVIKDPVTGKEIALSLELLTDADGKKTVGSVTLEYKTEGATTEELTIEFIEGLKSLLDKSDAELALNEDLLNARMQDLAQIIMEGQNRRALIEKHMEGLTIADSLVKMFGWNSASKLNRDGSISVHFDQSGIVDSMINKWEAWEAAGDSPLVCMLKMSDYLTYLGSINDKDYTDEELEDIQQMIYSDGFTKSYSWLNGGSYSDIEGVAVSNTNSTTVSANSYAQRTYRQSELVTEMKQNSLNKLYKEFENAGYYVDGAVYSDTYDGSEYIILQDKSTRKQVRFYFNTYKNTDSEFNNRMCRNGVYNDYKNMCYYENQKIAEIKRAELNLYMAVATGEDSTPYAERYNELSMQYYNTPFATSASEGNLTGFGDDYRYSAIPSMMQNLYYKYHS